MATVNPSSPSPYADLRQLMLLEHRGGHFNFLPHQPNHSVLAGQHGSKLRGRGLNFLELRSYQPSDDIRTIDWKVTARTRKPYTRVFSEERERPALLILDQRRSMFFGSVFNMKSTTAAEIAAMATWRVLAAKDRIGAIIFSDDAMHVIRPQRSRENVIRILKAIVELNNALSWKSSSAINDQALNVALRRARELVTHDCLILEITDGRGRDDQTRRLNSLLAQHNDLVIGYVFDPLERHLPRVRDPLVVGDGRQQLELVISASQRVQFANDHDDAFTENKRFWANRDVPVLPVSAAEPTGPQLLRLLTTGRRESAGM